MTKREFSLKSFIALLVLVLLGFTFILCAAYAQDPENGFPLKTILSTLGTTLIISGGSTIVFDYLSKKEFLELIENNNKKVTESINLYGKINDIGLIYIETESNQYLYRELLEEDDEVYLCLNDGRTWLSKNAEFLEKRLRDNNKVTNITLMNPESLATRVQAEKTKTNEEAIKMKFNESIEILKKLKAHNSKLNIFIHNYYNPQAVYMCQKYAIVTPYYTSSGRRDVPLYRYIDSGEKSYFRRIRDDVLQLIKMESTLYNI